MMPNNQEIVQATNAPLEAQKKKKKRNRIRNRKRNKCNRCSAEVTTPTELNATSSVPLMQESNIKSEIDRPLTNEFLKTHKNLNGKIEKKDNNDSFISKVMQPTANSIMKNPPAANAVEKTREEIIAEREAKKLAKQAKKSKTVFTGDKVSTKIDHCTASVFTTCVHETAHTTEKEGEIIKAEREPNKLAKPSAKAAKGDSAEKNLLDVTANNENVCVAVNITSEEKKKPALTKAERRAIQEAQRAAKSQALAEKNKPPKLTQMETKPKTTMPTNVIGNSKLKSSAKGPVQLTSNCKVRLFNHLENKQNDVSLFLNNSKIHPSVTRLGEQYAKRTVVGSNARCIAFLNALKMVIQDFETPPKKEFTRSLEAVVKISVEHLQKCRPLAVSVSNAYKHIKHVLTQLPADQPESELKEHLCHFIDTYIENQIGKAAQAISCSMQEKIKNGDVILTFGCSSLINYICEEAHRRHVHFRVIVVDSRPFCEGQELLRRLAVREIPCTYVLINAVGFVMPEATKVLLGAHALLSNGYVMARTGTAQVALVANSFNVPVLVCCETHKFSERFQTDAIVYNELGDPHDLVLNEKCSLTNWQTKNKISPLNLIYDITPPELVTAVVTEVSILPCTSVPVILRIKPTEIGYYS